MTRLRLGVDMGGTFTDLALSDGRRLLRGKRLTDQADPGDGILDAVTEFLAEHGLEPSDIDEIIHGTTLGSNVVLERNGQPTALLTTAGFRDILIIQRQRRHELYNLMVGKPEPLVPRSRVFEVPERIGADGTIVRPLDTGGVERIAEQLAGLGVRDIAVCLLHSYRSDVHEQELRVVLERCLPGVHVSLSSEVTGRQREYERASTTVINAYVGGRVRDYLRSLERRLRGVGFTGALYVMQSNGGLATVGTVLRFPVRMIESGPAAGANMAAQVGHPDASRSLAFDMGGTTAKVSLSHGGQPDIAHEFEIDRLTLRPGSGLPVDIPSVDLIEVGSGGGSIAHVDEGILTVGPESASSAPGPACYGLGGTRPTVTDANLLLGYLDPDGFLGGRMRLDVQAARDAIRRDVADPLGLSVDQAAWAIHEIVTDDMAAAARMISVERGRDPRSYTLVASGGAGPAHAVEIAAKLRVPRVVLPGIAGVFSAVGLLSCDLRFEAVASAVQPLEEGGRPEIRATLDTLERRVTDMLAGGGVHADRHSVERVVDARYRGQGYQLPLTIPDEPLDRACLDRLVSAFHERHESVYGHNDQSTVVEGVDWRVTAVVPRPRVVLPAAETTSPRTATPSSVRPVCLAKDGTFEPCPVYARGQLASGTRFDGPAIVEDAHSTAVLPPACAVEVDERGDLVVTFKETA